MKTTHTPGPWIYQESTKTIRSIPTNYWLATMDSWDGAIDNKANARLIAAAPDLHEALTEVMENYERDAAAVPGILGSPHVQYAFHLARTALAKAQGKHTVNANA